MALDHQNARSAAIFPSMPGRVVMPAPDGAVGAQDRAHVAYAYILASGSSDAGGTNTYASLMRRRRRS